MFGTDDAAKVPALLRALTATGRVWLIATLRSDRYAALQTDRDLLELKRRGTVYDLPPPGEAEISDIVKGPARAAGLAFQGGERNGKTLARLLVEQTPSADALPLLQMTLRRLFDARDGMTLTWQAYEAMGGVSGAIATHADAVLASFLPAVRSELPDLISKLTRDVTRGASGRGMRFTTTAADAGWAATPARQALVNRMVQKRLLVEDEPESGRKVLRVAHEALLRQWRPANTALEAIADRALRRARLLLFAAFASAVVFLLVAAGAYWFYWQAKVAEGVASSAKQQAQQGKAEAERQTAFAKNQAVLALAAEDKAKAAALAAQRALTDSFFRTIGVSGQNVPPRDEREALWELAQLDRANAAVRDNLLKWWFGTIEAFTRGEVRGGQGFRAATGLNVDYHLLATSKAAEAGRLVAAALEESRETNPDRLLGLGNALVALAAKMEPPAAAEVAKGLAVALENPKETDPDRLLILGNALAALAAKMEPQAAAEIARRGVLRLAAALENHQTRDPDPLEDSDPVSSLRNALAALAAKMEPQAAAEIAKGLAAALENPKETDLYSLSNLGNALAALAAKMEPQAAAEVAKGLAMALENPKETNSGRLSFLGSALAALADKMEPQAAAEIASRGVQRLVAALENPKETDPDRLSILCRALAALAAKMDPQAAAKIAKGLAVALGNLKETDSGRLSFLCRALAALATKMEPQAAAEIASRGVQRLAAALENPQTHDLSNLGSALAALAAKMEPQAAAEIAKGLAVALDNPKETSSGRLSFLCSVLAALAAKMEPQAAAEIAKRLAAAWENLKETDPSYLYSLSNLGNALAALAAKMEPQAAAEIASRGVQRLAAALENPQVTDPYRDLGNALAALATKMDPQAAAEVAKGLAVALENPKETDPTRLLSLGNALAALAAKMDPQAAAEVAKGLAVAWENLKETDPYRVSILGRALVALATKMDPRAAAEIARRGAQRLATALENPQVTDSVRLLSFGKSLAALCALLPSAHHAQLLALSNLLLVPVSEKAEEAYPFDWKTGEDLAAVCAQLPPQDLAEVLKYPFCTGKAEQIVLDQLKAKTQRDFGGDVWKFVEQADALGIKDVGSPAERPSAQEALNELDKL